MNLDKVSDLTTQRNFETLERLVPGTGDRTIDFRWGTATITWPGGDVNSDVITQAHGINRTPVVAFVQPSNEGGSYESVVGFNASDLSIQLRRTDGTTPGAGATLTVYWLALG